MGFLSRLFGQPTTAQQSTANRPISIPTSTEQSRGYRPLQVSMHCNVLNLEDELAAVVPRHRDVLLKKYNELMTIDDYGEVDATAWEQEIIKYARRFADFNTHCTAVREELDFQVEVGDIDAHTATELMTIFATVIPVRAIEGLIGVSEPRPRTDLDREAELLRREARWQVDQALSERGLQRPQDEQRHEASAVVDEKSALGNGHQNADGFHEDALAAHVRDYSVERLKAMTADASLAREARNRASAELKARGH